MFFQHDVISRCFAVKKKLSKLVIRIRPRAALAGLLVRGANLKRDHSSIAFRF